MPARSACPAEAPSPARRPSLALRELHEELGVDPAGVRMLGGLPPIYVYASNFFVRPFVALASERPPFRPDPGGRRTAGSAPAAPVGPTELPNTRDRSRAASFEAPCITFQGRHIWGVTALILGELLNVIVDRERDSLFTP